VKLYADLHSPELDELLDECELARSEMLANQRMRWYVADADGHDDLLVSLALAVHAAADARPRAASGRTVRRET
jgi:hypothetical protein